MSPAHTVCLLDHSAIDRYGGDLVSLLADAVNGGASVGFIAPLSLDVARGYWEQVRAQVSDGHRLVLAALEGEGANATLVGCVHLVLSTPPNGRHRAEVQKLLVLMSRRRRGIAAMLMAQAEVEARQHQRSLLVLDTQAGSPSEKLYSQCGYMRAGTIPRYALNHDGSELIDTVVYYKLL